MNNYFLSEKNEIKNKPDLVLYFLLLVYIVSLFLKDSPVVSNILISLLFILSLVTAKGHYRQRILGNKVSLGIVIFYLYQVLSVLLSDNIKSGFSILLLRLPLLILPLSVALMDFEKRTWNKLLLFYALATTVASVIGFGYGVYKTVMENDSGNLYNDNISDFIGKQAVYFALYTGVAILVFTHTLKENPPVIQKYRWQIYLAIGWLLFIIFMLASRTAMIGLLLILGIYILNIGLRKKKYIEISLLVFFLIIGGFLLTKTFPKTLNKFKGATEISYQFDNRNVENHFNAEYDASKWNGTNTRAAIWTCAWNVWKREPLLGTGLGDRNNELMNEYRENKFWYGLGSEKNTHNQYLDVLLSMGILGLIVFLLGFFIYPFRIFLRQKQTFPILAYLLVAMCFLTENMLDRYQGFAFIALILPLISKAELTDKN